MADAINLLGQSLRLAWNLFFWVIVIPSLIIGSWVVVVTIALFWKVFEPVFKN